MIAVKYVGRCLSNDVRKVYVQGGICMAVTAKDRKDYHHHLARSDGLEGHCDRLGVMCMTLHSMRISA